MLREDTEHMWRSLQRVTTVAVRLEIGAVSLCPAALRAELGVGAWTRQNPDKVGGTAAEINAAFELHDDAAKVLWIIPGSAGDRAGIRPGDLLAPNLLADAYDTWAPGVPHPVEVTRGGRRLSLTVVPDAACAFTASLLTNDAIDAYADGTMVRITQGMVDFVHNDEELAFIIAHELAHNLRHQAAIRADTISKEMESEADYLAVYIMAIAGMDYHQTTGIFRRLAERVPSIDLVSNHPAIAQREAALHAAIREVDSKKIQGRALLPDMRQ